MPHFGYARQDRQAKIREPISARLMSNLLVRAGADHIIALNLHSDQIQGFFDVVTDNLSTRKIFAEYFLNKKLPDVVVVSPDTGGAKAAEKFAKKLDAPLAILHKTRPRHNVSEVSHVIGDIKGKNVIIYDDLIDTAGTICNAKEALLERGANPSGVYLAATHAVFSGPAIDRFKEAKFTEVVVTNSIPLTKEQHFDGLHIVSVAPLLSNVMEAIIEHKSASIYHI
jgi:ribose-phosphate pyrophosphokinase